MRTTNAARLVRRCRTRADERRRAQWVSCCVCGVRADLCARFFGLCVVRSVTGDPMPWTVCSACCDEDLTPPLVVFDPEDPVPTVGQVEDEYAAYLRSGGVAAGDGAGGVR